MKIEFEVPEWAIGKHIYIFAGTELLGKKEVRIYHEDGEHKIRHLPLEMKQKDGRCNGCGSCCAATGIPQKLLDDMRDMLNNPREDGCPLLNEDGCIMKAWTPFSCLKSVCSAYEGCTEKLEVIE